MKVYGKFKVEIIHPVRGFCGLRPKMYSFSNENKTAKGLKKSMLSFSDYTDTLFGDDISKPFSYNTIRQQKHQIGTYRVKMRGLCRYDDKRYIYNNIDSLAHGHKLTRTPSALANISCGIDAFPSH